MELPASSFSLKTPSPCAGITRLPHRQKIRHKPLSGKQQWFRTATPKRPAGFLWSPSACGPRPNLWTRLGSTLRKLLPRCYQKHNHLKYVLFWNNYKPADQIKEKYRTLLYISYPNLPTLTRFKKFFWWFGENECYPATRRLQCAWV